MSLTGVLALCAGLGVPGQPALTQEMAGEAVIPYATVKRPAQSITRREALHFVISVPYPERGVLIAGGGLFSAGAIWTIADFDARTLLQVRTMMHVLPGGRVEAVISNRQSRHLAASELNEIIEQANAVWNPPHPPALPRMLTDVTCDVVLFDGADVLRDSGSACPSEELVEAMQKAQSTLNPGR